MRKVLVILLIAVIACSEITEIKDVELGKITESLKERAIKWLKQWGIYEKVLDRIRTSGRLSAKNLCIKVTSSGLCNSYVDALQC